MTHIPTVEVNIMTGRVLGVLVDVVKTCKETSSVSIDARFTDETLKEATVLGDMTMVPINPNTVVDVRVTLDMQMPFKEALGLFELLRLLEPKV